MIGSVELAGELTAVQQPAATERRWRAATLLAFRWCFVYFGLYVATTQMLPAMVRIPAVGIPLLGVLPPARNIFLWIASNVLGISAPIRYGLTGSGDRMFDWVQAFSLALISVGVVAFWSLIDRRRQNHASLN
jgi:ABC-type xylose transport system permease subunit